MEDGKPLTTYKTLGPRSTVFLVLRLPGGSSTASPFDLSVRRNPPRHIPRSGETCYICFENDEVLLMPCDKVRHSMCTGCLIEYAWEESKNKSKICCSLCGSEWGLDVIKEYSQASDEELDLLAETLSLTMIRRDSNISNCPGCDSYCEQKDAKRSRVHCRYCAQQGKKNPDFCWHCRQDWQSSSNDECGNAECNAAGILAQIQAAPMAEVIGVRCPSIRLCPKCGTAIEHKSGCKHMTCKTCKADFCFLCLRIRSGRSWQCGSYNTKCTVAPVQTCVPGR